MGKIFWLQVFLFLLSVHVSGQALNVDSIFEPRLCGRLYEMQSGYNGKQFYNDAWIAGDILLTNGEIARNKLLRYNGLIDELIWRNDANSTIVKLEKHFISEFQLKNFNGKTIRFKRIRARSSVFADTSGIFAEVLTESKAQCYVYRKIIVKGYDIKEKGGKTYISDDLVAQPQYILIFPDKEIVIFRRISKHGILKALPASYRTAVKGLIQKNHLSLRNEEELRTMVGLIN